MKSADELMWAVGVLNTAAIELDSLCQRADMEGHLMRYAETWQPDQEGLELLAKIDTREELDWVEKLQRKGYRVIPPAPPQETPGSGA